MTSRGVRGTTELGQAEVMTRRAGTGGRGMAEPAWSSRMGRWVPHHRLLVLSLAMLVVVPGGAHPRAGGGQTAFWFTQDTSPYRSLIDLYREGDADEAIEQVITLGVNEVHRIAGTLRNGDMTEDHPETDPGEGELLSRAAAMLHLDAADQLWSAGLEQAAKDQIEVAVIWIDLGTRSPEPAGSFRRRWYLGVGLLAFERGGWHAAFDFVDHACEVLADDVPLLTTAAWLNEQLALAARGERSAAFDRRYIPAASVAPRSNTAGMLPRRALQRPDAASLATGLGATPDFHHGLLAPAELGNTGTSGLRTLQRAKRDRLQEAARRASAALAVTSDATEAALPLARVKMLLQEEEEARALLRGLVGRTDLPMPHAYLARLMLGRLYMQTAEPKRAEPLFLEASDLNPGGQAARVARAQLLDALGDRRGAAAALEPVLTAEPGGIVDPWVDYLLGIGNGPALRATLREMVRLLPAAGSL